MLLDTFFVDAFAQTVEFVLSQVVRKLEAGLVDAEYHAAYAIDNVARQEVAVMEKYATKLR